MFCLEAAGVVAPYRRAAMVYGGLCQCSSGMFAPSQDWNYRKGSGKREAAQLWSVEGHTGQM